MLHMRDPGDIQYPGSHHMNNDMGLIALEIIDAEGL